MKHNKVASDPGQQRYYVLLSVFHCDDAVVWSYEYHLPLTNPVVVSFTLQFWRNTDDADVIRFLKLFTELSMHEIHQLEQLSGARINQAKVSTYG